MATTTKNNQTAPAGVPVKQEPGTALTKANDIFLPMIERQLMGHRINMDEYSRVCVLSAMSAINAVLVKSDLNWASDNLDKSSLTDILLKVASLKLSASATPREVYFQIRTIKIGNEWKKQIEMGIEGDGNDALLSRYGRGVEKVYQFWLIREGDEFSYPEFNGIELTPPKWKPHGQGEVIRVVYPVKKTSGEVDYYIAERADVAANLIAHISNQMMNETFGICADRYKATDDQKKKIAEKKAEIITKAKVAGLGALDDPDLLPYISPAWSEPQSREQMIIRKMRNNIVKKIPKDFGSGFLQGQYEEATNDEYRAVAKEIKDNANTIPIEATFSGVDAPDAPQEEQKAVVVDDDTGEVIGGDGGAETVANDAPQSLF